MKDKKQNLEKSVSKTKMTGGIDSNIIYSVVDYILSKQKDGIVCMKLQKLLYYSQAWSLVWDESPLFSQRIEAWANGPVIPDIYNHHRLQYDIPKDFFKKPAYKKPKLSETQIETIDAVLKEYGNKTAHYLSELTHQEKPWKEARKGLEPGERSNREITLVAMSEYYSSL